MGVRTPRATTSRDAVVRSDDFVEPLRNPVSELGFSQELLRMSEVEGADVARGEVMTTGPSAEVDGASPNGELEAGPLALDLLVVDAADSPAARAPGRATTRSIGRVATRSVLSSAASGSTATSVNCAAANASRAMFGGSSMAMRGPGSTMLLAGLIAAPAVALTVLAARRTKRRKAEEELRQFVSSKRKIAESQPGFDSMVTLMSASAKSWSTSYARRSRSTTLD